MQLLEHQAEFIQSEFIHTGIVGGYRSGKSQAGVIKTVLKKLKYPGVDVAYYLPTYGLIKDIAYPKFSAFLTECGVEYVLNKTDHEYVTSFGRIILRSMDNPETIIGYEVGYSLIDEADVLPTTHMEDVLIKVVARLSVPLPNDDPNCLDFVSTPEGFKFLYQFFVKKPHANKKLIRAKTRNNPWISKSYIETLMMNYTEQQLEAYLNGEFVNLTTGSVYHKFNREANHSNRIVKNGDVLHVGMDFNITNMTALIHVIDTLPDYKIMTAVDEIIGAHDTSEMTKLLKDKFQGHQIVVYPDASGKARKTSSDTTDHQILKNAKFKLVVDESNPAVKERVTIMNISFKNNREVVKYFVNTNTCPTYTEGLEQLTYKNGVPDKTSGHDHVTEAGGYCVWHQFKIKTVKKFSISAS